MLVLASGGAHTPALVTPPETRPPPPDRYEPMPGVGQLPGWLWRKLGRRGRLLAGLLVLAGVAVSIPLALNIDSSKDERSRAEQRERAQSREQRLAALRAEQQPRFGRSDAIEPAGAGAQARLAGRAASMDVLAGAILADARRRVRAGKLEGPVRRVECEPFPRSVGGRGAEADLRRAQGRYYCVAVTAEFGRSRGSAGGALGHPYRARVDFESGRFGYCKISGRADPTAAAEITTPPACGG